MVSAVMLNDQDMPVAFERSGEGDKPVMGRHNLGPRASRIGNATFGLSKLVAGAVLGDDAPADRVGDLSFFRERLDSRRSRQRGRPHHGGILVGGFGGGRPGGIRQTLLFFLDAFAFRFLAALALFLDLRQQVADRRGAFAQLRHPAVDVLAFGVGLPQQGRFSFQHALQALLFFFQRLGFNFQ
jgi:hypothetical protein